MTEEQVVRVIKGLMQEFEFAETYRTELLTVLEYWPHIPIDRDWLWPDLRQWMLHNKHKWVSFNDGF